MEHEELIQLIISLRPNGIEPEAIPAIVILIASYFELKSNKDELRQVAVD